MAIGVPETDVFHAADRVLARGERPTVERVRAVLGRGSPARVGQLLEQWWDRLAKRLAGETQLPDLPADAAAAFKTVWALASEQAMAIAEQRLSDTRQVLEQDKAALAAERARWSADLDSALADVSGARDAQMVAEQRFADHQRLVEQLQTELRDVKVQRDKLQEQEAAGFSGELSRERRMCQALGFQRCGSNSAMREFGWVGRRMSTSRR